jgi:hypothetical protein
MWTFYGFFGIMQPAIWAPNMIGAVLSVFQLVLIALYGSKNNITDIVTAANPVVGLGVTSDNGQSAASSLAQQEMVGSEQTNPMASMV